MKLSRVELKIEDVADIKHGFAFKGKYFSEDRTKYSLVTPGNFSIGGGFKEKNKYYNGPFKEEYILKKDDLIITMTDLSKLGDTLGYSALVPQEDKYLHNQRIGLVVMKSKEVLKEYLYWVMRTKSYQQYIVNHSTGSTVKHTSPSTIKSYKFHVPPLKIQKEIVGILSSIEEKIELNKKINHHLEEMINTYFLYILNNSKLQHATFGQLGTIVSGGTPSKKVEEYWGGDIPWLTPKDLSLSPTMFTSKGQNSITELGYQKSSAKLMPKDSILFSSRAPIGYMTISKNEICTNQGFKSIIPNNGYPFTFVYQLLKNEVKSLEKNASGSTFKEVSGTQLKNHQIFIPDMKNINQFHDFSLPLFQKIQNIEEEIAILQSLRDELLPRLLSGEIQVINLQNIIE